MSITTTISFLNVSPTVGEQRFLDRGCFGVHNHLDDFLARDHTGNSASPRINLGTVVEQMEVLDFWPHVYNQESLNSIPDWVDVFNSMSCYKDMFTYTSAGSISVNLRNNPADKVFTGLMAIRDSIYGYMNGLEFLFEGVTDKEELLKRKRIAQCLRLAGMSCDFFGRWSTANRLGSQDESCAIWLHPSMSAASLLPIFDSSDEYSENVWIQDPVGISRNRNGYVRNHDTSLLRAMAREKGFNQNCYETMSQWLYCWINTQGKKRPIIDERKPNITIEAFTQRVRASTERSDNNDDRSSIIVSLFEDLKEYFQ